jgi:protein-export chaperone SecB
MAKKSKPVSGKSRPPVKPQPKPAPVKAAAPASAKKPAVASNGKSAAPAPAPSAPKTGLRQVATYLKQLRLESPRPLENFSTKGPAPQIVIQVNVQARQVRTGVVEVDVHLNARTIRAERELYSLAVCQSGLFELQGLSAEAADRALKIECPKLLMPALKSAVAEASRRSGFGEITLGDVDFSRLAAGRS